MNIDLHQLKQTNPIEVVVRKLGLQGSGRRLWCPSCQAAGAAQHRTPDLAIYSATGTFCCWKCGSKGDVISLVQLALGCAFKEAIRWLGIDEAPRPRQLSRQASARVNIITSPPSPPPSHTAHHVSSLFETHGGNKIYAQNFERMAPALSAFQWALPGSQGERYLRSRGITLETAMALHLGYSAPGRWLNPRRDAPAGRLVFPHTDSSGRVVNLYGRAVEFHSLVPKHLRHDHIPSLPKAFFNAASLTNEEVFLVEGPFCALALYQSGYRNVSATFGVHGLRWDQVKAMKVVLAFDHDESGSSAANRLSYEGILRGKEIFRVPCSTYKGCKDLAESFAQFGPITLENTRNFREKDNP